MKRQAHIHPLLSMTSTSLVLSLSSQSLASITTLNYNISYVISSVTIINVGAQLKSIGDALESTHAKHVMWLTSRLFFTWCLRALHVMYEAVKWTIDVRDPARTVSKFTKSRRRKCNNMKKKLEMYCTISAGIRNRSIADFSSENRMSTRKQITSWNVEYDKDPLVKGELDC